MVHLQVLPVGIFGVRNLCHRHGRGNEPRAIRSAGSRVGVGRRLSHRVQRLPLVAVLPGGVRGYARSLVDRSDPVARWMATALPELAKRPAMGPGILAGSGAIVLRACRTVAARRGTHAKDSAAARA